MSLTIKVETNDGVKLPSLTTAQALDVFSQLAELLGQNLSTPLLFGPGAAHWLKPSYKIPTDLPPYIQTPPPVPIDIFTCGDPLSNIASDGTVDHAHQ
jgi:hypothetical protein